MFVGVCSGELVNLVKNNREKFLVLLAWSPSDAPCSECYCYSVLEVPRLPSAESGSKQFVRLVLVDAVLYCVRLAAVQLTR